MSSDTPWAGISIGATSLGPFSWRLILGVEVAVAAPRTMAKVIARAVKLVMMDSDGPCMRVSASANLKPEFEWQQCTHSGTKALASLALAGGAGGGFCS